jgi:hypothetical protein
MQVIHASHAPHRPLGLVQHTMGLQTAKLL